VSIKLINYFKNRNILIKKKYRWSNSWIEPEVTYFFNILIIIILQTISCGGISYYSTFNVSKNFTCDLYGRYVGIKIYN